MYTEPYSLSVGTSWHIKEIPNDDLKKCRAM